jgi:sugar phosphate isomerase/epimerase
VLKAVRWSCGNHHEYDFFQLHESWLQGHIGFWQAEINRWERAGIEIVLENDTEKTPDLLVRLVEAVNHPFLGLCLDIGHQHVFSSMGALVWVSRMGKRLYHFHLHDNDSSRQPLAAGAGTIE